MKQPKIEIVAFIETIAVVMLCIVFFLFPILFLPITTDSFSIPKQMLLAIGVITAIILLQVRIILEGKVRVRRTPFDVPLFFLALVSFVSSLLAINQLDAVIAYIPFFLSILLCAIIINTISKVINVIYLLTSLAAGTGIASLISILAFFKIYLPFAFMPRTQAFSPFGTMLEQALFFAALLPAMAYFAYSILRTKEVKRKHVPAAIIAGSFLFTAIGMLMTIYTLFTIQKPVILPFETGFQTAFAAISQDTGRVAQGFLFGSGYGTYANDFTRYKQPAFNLENDLWNLTFFKSTTFFLELLATIGLLGIAAWLFLLSKVVRISSPTKLLKENPFYLSLIILIILSFVFPFFFSTLVVLFVLLGMFSVLQAAKNKHEFFEVELHFVAFRNGFVSLSHAEEGSIPKRVHSLSKILPIGIFIFSTIFIGILSFFIFQYAKADMLFQNSLSGSAAEKARDKYNTQLTAINTFPYRDGFYRVFSQTNLLIATSLLNAQPKDATPSAEVQKDILSLIQQSINSARSATTVSPQTSANWQNLSAVYRALIGFGQNAENFAVLSNRQAAGLDPNNPQQYISLGGLYYQLGQWDLAQQQFQVATQLKPDFPNAYYNLGHAIEQKGDLKNALIHYQTALDLLVKLGDKESEKILRKEMSVLREKIVKSEKENTNQLGVNPQISDISKEQQQSEILGISSPSAKLPPQQKQIKIPAPNITVNPQISPTPSQIPTPTP